MEFGETFYLNNMYTTENLIEWKKLKLCQHNKK